MTNTESESKRRWDVWVIGGNGTFHTKERTPQEWQALEDLLMEWSDRFPPGSGGHRLGNFHRNLKDPFGRAGFSFLLNQERSTETPESINRDLQAMAAIRGWGPLHTNWLDITDAPSFDFHK